MSVEFEFDYEKMFEALVYLASHPDEVTALDKYKAGKLLFLADKYHLVQFGRPIVGDQYRALEYGPIPQETLDYLNGFDCQLDWLDCVDSFDYLDCQFDCLKP